MNLDSLTILQVQKKQSSQIPQFDLVESFFVESCLRKLWITSEDYFSYNALDLPPQVEVFRGVEAYHLLLKISCGLKSEMIGETDIFGQLKEAWAQYLSSHSTLSKELHPWFNRLFEDAKDIRSGFLLGLGGAQSYGGAVKKLLGFRPKDSVLLIGAGALAQSIAPFLNETRLSVWNRTPEKRIELVARLTSEDRRPDEIKSLAELQQAWLNADYIVLTIPEGGLDLSSPLFSKTKPGARLLHLGCLEESDKNTRPDMQILNDVFRVQKQQSEQQLEQINLAKKACWERAQLRDLGQGSLSLSHGWEDLALFE